MGRGAGEIARTVLGLAAGVFFQRVVIARTGEEKKELGGEGAVAVR